MPYLKALAIVVCVAMSLGGAVNSGFSSFFMAVPFMALLAFLAFTYGKKYLAVAGVFIASCVLVSLTQDHNSFIYPILSDGTVTILHDGYHVTYSVDGSGGYNNELSFYTQREGAVTDKIRQFEQDPSMKELVTTDQATVTLGGISADNITIVKVRQGDVYPVTGIKHDHGDFGDRFSVVTPLGDFSHYDISPLHQDGAAPVAINKPIQAAWAKNIGMLMIYPVFITSPDTGIAIIKELFK